MADPLDPVHKVEFPMICPECKASGGLPYMASTQAGRPEIVRIALRCHHCRVEWTHDMTTGERPFRESP